MVAYDARAEWDYSILDWSARDEQDHRYESVSWARPPTLVDGSLVSGRHADGWLAFLVPDSASRVWLDFRASDGSVIFTVQIDGPPPETPRDPAIPAGPTLPVI